MSKVYQRVLIGLDCLCDTRLGLALTHKPDSMTMVRLDDYSKRSSDDTWTWFGISEEKWKRLWEDRDVECLKNAMPTLLLDRLAGILKPKVVKGLGSKLYGELEVTINIWPYEVNPELLVEAFKDRLNLEMSVTTVSIPDKELTPDMLSENWDSIFMYSMHDWLKLHNVALAKKPMPRVIMYYPAVFDHRQMDAAKNLTEDSPDPFMALRAQLARFVVLEALDIELFSSFRPLDRTL